MTKPHQFASKTEFNSFAEEWITSNVDIEDLLSVPGVANLILEEYNNKIIEAFDEAHEE